VSTDSVDGGDNDVGEAHTGIYREGWLPVHNSIWLSIQLNICSMSTQSML